MLRSRIVSAERFSSVLRCVRCCVVVFLTTVISGGCGNSCFVGFSNNGNGGVIVKAGNPPPACSLPQTNGAMSVSALKPLVCGFCAAPGPQHVFVTLRGVQLGTSTMAEPQPADWLEIAPRLREEPLQIDLIGGSVPEVLVDNAAVPPGTYRQVRLRLLADSEPDDGKLRSQNACGQAHHNCIVTAGGRIDDLGWSADPDFLVVAGTALNGALLVPPGAKMDLFLSFELTQRLYSSGAEPLQPRTVLTGRASALQPLISRPAPLAN
jgi:hypothetical protein